MPSARRAVAWQVRSVQHSPMGLKLDADALKILAERRCGSLDKLAARSGVARATMYRWTQGENLPNDPSRLLAIARALDVDPLVLWKMDRDLYSTAKRFVSQVTRKRSWSALFGGLSYLDEVLFPAFEWPGSGIARSLGRAWEAARFEHIPREQNNYYQRVRLASETEFQVWYFAYRHFGGIMEAWQPYGIVIRQYRFARLFSVTTYDELAIPDGASDVATETWFGPGSAEFKVCSIHPVRVSLTSSTDGAALRFRL